MKIGSLFSGIGGLDLAAEAAFVGRTVWQCEIEPFARKVLEVRWPDAVRHDDVRALTKASAAKCDVITGGFPCTDLSVAGKRAGLDGERSGLYHEMMRIVDELRPEWIVFENVPPLLKYRSRVEGDLERIGYGSVWQVCEASDVGAPHRRQRVFVVARRGLGMHVMLPRPSLQGDLFAPAFGSAAAARLWPTPTICGNDNHKGASATSGDGLATAVKAWPTPAARDWKDSGHEPSAQRRNSPGLPASVVMATWPTPTASDGSGGPGSSGRDGGDNLRTAASGDSVVLNPLWVELLMGLSPGWTDPDCDQLGAHRWPSGRGEPQHPDEPHRLVPPKSVANRGKRLKALGNAVVWQQAHAAIARAIAIANKC